MKQVSVILLGGLACLLLSQRQGITESEALVYANHEQGFRVTLPPGWSFHERPKSLNRVSQSLGGDIAVILTEHDRGVAGEFNPNITVAVRPMSEIATIKDANTMVHLARQVLESVAPVEQPSSLARGIETNGLVGAERRFVFSQRYGDQKLKLVASVTALISARRGRCLLITAIVPEDFWNQYKSLFRNCVESLQELN